MFVSSKEIEVRYAETDQMGVVYHANYIIWMEVGRTELIQDLGFSYAAMEKDGIISPVVDIQIEYKKPITYGEKAIIHTWIEKYNGIKTVYGYEIFNSHGELAAKGFSSHVCVKKETFRPVVFKKLYPEWHEAYVKAMKEER